jgi:hypothetical protein
MCALQLAKFERLDPSDLTRVVESLDVQYNPNEFTLDKRANIAAINIPGLDMPILQYVRGEAETLALDLFFDTTDTGLGDTARAVTILTDKFYRMIKIDRTTHAIPICRFVWGAEHFAGTHFTGQWSSQNQGRINGFQCVVESVRQRFTLFSPRGVPLRATLTLQLREYKTLAQQIQEIRFESPDHTHTHVVQRGDTLTRIAYRVYGDATQWRAIAEHNDIVNPLDLEPGRVLDLPPIR